MLSAPSIHGHEKSVTWFHYASRNNKGISCLTKVMMVVTPVLSVDRTVEGVERELESCRLDTLVPWVEGR